MDKMKRKTNVALPLERIEVLSDELFFVAGGAAALYAPGTGCGCGCENRFGEVVGCGCYFGTGCGCECRTGEGCGCGCTQPTSALD